MVEKLNEDRYDDLIKEGYTIVDFSATWCGPCQRLAPIMEDISEEFKDKVSFYNIDIDENVNLVTKLEVQSIPTIVLYKDGKEVDRKIGFLPKNMLNDWINSNI